MRMFMDFPINVKSTIQRYFGGFAMTIRKPSWNLGLHQLAQFFLQHLPGHMSHGLKAGRQRHRVGSGWIWVGSWVWSSRIRLGNQPEFCRMTWYDVHGVHDEYIKYNLNIWCTCRIVILRIRLSYHRNSILLEVWILNGLWQRDSKHYETL